MAACLEAADLHVSGQMKTQLMNYLWSGAKRWYKARQRLWQTEVLQETVMV